MHGQLQTLFYTTKFLDSSRILSRSLNMTNSFRSLSFILFVILLISVSVVIDTTEARPSSTMKPHGATTGTKKNGRKCQFIGEVSNSGPSPRGVGHP